LAAASNPLSQIPIAWDGVLRGNLVEYVMTQKAPQKSRKCINRCQNGMKIYEIPSLTIINHHQPSLSIINHH
jgi:hypothetical protein